MATQMDLPVKYNGKLYRFISDGTKAGLFGKGGVLEVALTVDKPSQGNLMPAVTTVDGKPVRLSRSSRPCSCKGAPWSTRYSDLAASL